MLTFTDVLKKAGLDPKKVKLIRHSLTHKKFKECYEKGFLYEYTCHQKMTDVRELDTKVKPMKQVEGLEHGLNLPKHMAEHIYMFSGPTVNVKMETVPEMFSDITDWFGTDVKIVEETEDKLIVRVNCNEKAMRYWALQYGPSVEILEPESLRNQLIADMKDMLKRYRD
ncbi:WYL domain-containing protein [Butyrivibrio sp. XB500-5]|uniref:WYL domain-containing protein n=1 Tax=Butyrivibrio sp. XB500-5 TaxID=2364880 RepID=UPI000EA9BCE0|nr:WYL domain-containing protein [Butyrivibrio sp. XB500-5]RKM63012.1 WYL domain-containing protein [Butyrivibrio sp. XB500-5]